MREIYVPHDELLKRAALDPSGVVMTLAEYRELVEKALKDTPPPRKPVEPPPLEAAALSGEIAGKWVNGAVRFRAEMEIAVAAANAGKWVRCDLGPAPPYLGSLSVDGKPGWAIVGPAEIPPAPNPQQQVQQPVQQQAQQAAPKPAAPERLYLILQGAGRHTARLEFSLPVREVEDRLILEGAVPATAASRLRVEVPGLASGESDPPYLSRSVVEEAPPKEGEEARQRTVFEIALGARHQFRLSWKLERSRMPTEAVFIAEHRVLYRLSPESPAVSWDLAVDIFRRKTDRLAAASPPGVQILRAEGPQLHSFKIVEEGGAQRLEILLHQPMLGRVEIHLEGILKPPPLVTPPVPPLARFTLGRPAVPGAIRDGGVLGLEEPGGWRLKEVAFQGLEPVAASEAPGVPPPPPPAGQTAARRFFAFAGAKAQLEAGLARAAASFQARSTYRLRFEEAGAPLQAAVRLAAAEGRLYSLEWSVPAGLRLIDLKEEGSALGLRWQAGSASGPEGARVRVDLDRALDPQSPLLFHATFALAALEGSQGEGWQRQELSIALPAFAEAQRERLALGIEVKEALAAALGDVSGWRAVPREDLGSLGFDAASLVAAIETERELGGSAPPIPLRLERRSYRGVYQAVVHALALERRLQIRAEVRLAAVHRPIEAIEVALPLPVDAPLDVQVPGLKEMTGDAASGRRRLLFQEPWLGERILRFEFEKDLAPEAKLAVPLVQIFPPRGRPGEAAAPEPGVFDPSRFVVLGSRGGVELAVQSGADLIPATLADLPEFSKPWTDGRVVASFRVRERAAAAGPASTFTATVHPRSPLLQSGIGELELITGLDRSGISRTAASFILRCSREQSLQVELMAGAVLRHVEIDGEAVRPIGGGQGTLRLPLPPRSYASVQILYERRSAALSTSGTWEEAGPRFGAALEEMPVGRVRWAVYAPPELHAELAGDTLDSLGGAPIETFSGNFWGRLLRFRWPRWTAWADVPLEEPAPPSAEAAAFEKKLLGALAGQGGASQGAPRGPAQAQLLVPVQKQAQQKKIEESLPALPLPPEGRRLEAVKLSGDPVVFLKYRNPPFERFAKRAVFLAAAAAGLLLLRLKKRAWLILYALGGLALGTFLPPALRWESPLLWIPFGEGLAAFLFVLALFKLAALAVGALRGVFDRWRSRRRQRRLAAAMLLGVLFLPAAALFAQSLKPALPPVEREAPGAAEEPVLIPYTLEELKIPQPPEKRRVYVPYRKFVELWNRAHPEEQVAVDESGLPAAVIIGNASYRLESDGASFRIDGDIAVKVLTRKWARLPLPFSGAQLAEIRIDGAPVGISYQDGIPFVPLTGAGDHLVQVALNGKVQRGLGEASIVSLLLASPSSALEARLPEGVEVDRQGSPGGAPVLLEERGPGEKPAHRLHLGSDGRIALRWRSAAIQAERPQNVAAFSAAAFLLSRDGWRVIRREQVQVEGPPVSHLRFQVLGRWELNDVRGNDVSEWFLRKREAAGEKDTFELEVFFVKKASAFDLAIFGFQAGGEEPVEPAGLSLAGATREEGLIGLRHHPLRRFPPEALSGLRRVSAQEFFARFQIPGTELQGIDRTYHFYNTPGAERLRSVPAAPEGGVQADFIGVIGLDRIAVAARVKYDLAGGPGPLEYRSPLPPLWKVKAARGEGVHDWEQRQEGNESRLVVRFGERARSGSQLEWYAEGPKLDPAALPAPYRFPALRAAGSLRQQSRWVLAAGEDLDLSADPATDMLPLPLEEAPRWLVLEGSHSYRMAFASSRDEAVLRVVASRRRPRLEAGARTLVRVAEKHVEVSAKVRLRISQAGQDAFRLRLPAAAGQVSVQLPNQRARQESRSLEGIEVLLTLPSPQVGELELELSYRLDRPAGAEIPVQGFEVLNAAPLEDRVAVVRNPLHLVKVTRKSGLAQASTAPREGPAPLRAETDFDLGEEFLVVARPWSLGLEEEELELRPGKDVVELAEIDTVLAADGSNWTKAEYTVLNRTRQFLEFEMPDGATLWRVLVDGRPVAVSRGPEAGAAAAGSRSQGLLVPVERLSETDLSLMVALIYSQPPLALPAAWQGFSPQAPRLRGVEIIETFWRLHLPEGYEVSAADGNLRRVIETYRQGEKVKKIVEQIHRIEEAKKGQQIPRRAEEQARKNLLQLEQALSDAVAEMEGGGRDLKAAAPPEKDLGKEELRQQLESSQQNLEFGRSKFRELQRSRAAPPQTRPAVPPSQPAPPPSPPAPPRTQPAEGPPALDPVDQAFEEARQFNENRWKRAENQLRRGPEAGAAAKGGVAGRPEGGERLESFQEAIPTVPAPPLPLEKPPAAAGEPGAQPPPAARAVAVRGAVDFEEESGIDIAFPQGGQLHTFSGKTSDPRIQVTLTSKNYHFRLGHWIGLIATAAGFLLAWRYRRSLGLSER